MGKVIATLFSMNSPICRSLPNATLKTNLRIRNSMKFCICLLLIILNFSDAIPLGKGKIEIREDLLCNIGDDHECVCNRTIGNLDNSFMNCLEFLQVNKLEVVNMVLRDINLKARLYTNETYEQYLRRRIAHILSQYCENMPEDCPGTLAAIRNHGKKSGTYELDEKTVTVLDDGPIFPRGNIVILRVQYPLGRGRTELSFVVLKMPNTIGINPTLMLNPTTVKYILSAQFAPLSRVLGGIRIEQFGIKTLEKPVEKADNTTLLIIIIVIAILMSICCSIAIVKVVIDIRKVRNLKRQNKETLTEGKSTRNYGTCTDKLFYNNYEVPNGRAKSKSVCSRESTNSKKMKRDKKLSKCSNDLTKVAVDNIGRNEEEVSPRAYQNIFVCDHSQLPKEIGDEEFEMELKRMKNQNLNVQSTRSPFSSDDDAAYQTFQFPDKPGCGGKRFSFSENIPCVILEDGNVTNGSENKEDGDQIQLDLKQKSRGSGGFLTTVNEDIERPHSRVGHPFDRPLSRRGSIDEKHEDGEEETFNDTQEDTPVPLGDDQVLVEKPLSDLLKKKRKKEVEKRLLTSETDSEGENSDEEGGGGLYKPLENKEAKRNGKIGSSSESDAEEEGKHEHEEMLERHQYERLLESPMPVVQDSKIAPKITLND